MVESTNNQNQSSDEDDADMMAQLGLGPTQIAYDDNTQGG